MDNQEVIQKVYLKSVKEIKEEWFISDIPHWYSYIINLPQDLQVTYLTIVFENQLLNGGFHQYFVNAYGQFSKEIIDALIEIGAFKKANLLNQALHIVQEENIDDVEFRKMLMTKTLKKLFIDDDLFNPLEELDDIYYDIDDEDISDLLGIFLIKKYN